MEVILLGQDWRKPGADGACIGTGSRPEGVPHVRVLIASRGWAPRPLWELGARAVSSGFWSRLERGLLFGCFTSDLSEFAAVVHRRSSSSWCFSTFTTFRIQHPPGTLPRGFIMNFNELAVQGQVMPNRVLPSGGAVAVPLVLEVGHGADHPLVDLRQRQPLLGRALDGLADQLGVRLVAPRVPPGAEIGRAHV